MSTWLGRAATKAEVRALTVSAVAPIYRARYWNAVRGDDLPAGLDYAVFDFAVNSGPGRAVMALQRALGVADDGRLGPVTLAALAGKDPTALIADLCDDRMAFLRKLSTWGSFGKGWTSRCRACGPGRSRWRVSRPPRRPRPSARAAARRSPPDDPARRRLPAHSPDEAPQMNSEQVAALARTLVQVGGGIAVGRGWITADEAATLGGAVVAIVATAWGLYARRNSALVASAAKVQAAADMARRLSLDRTPGAHPPS